MAQVDRKDLYDYSDDEINLKVTTLKNAISLLVSAMGDLSQSVGIYDWLSAAKNHSEDAVKEFRAHQVVRELNELDEEEY